MPDTARNFVAKLLVFAILSQPLAALRADDCRGKFSALDAAVYLLKTGAKITFFPFYAPGKAWYVVQDGAKEKRVMKIPFKLVTEDGIATLGYFLLFAGGATPSQWILNTVIGVNHDELAGPVPFPDDKAVGVGINGVGTDERYELAADFMSGAAQKNDRNLFHEKVKGPTAMIDTLLETYRKAGPIKRAVIAAHGQSGEMLIGGTRFDLKWVERNRDVLDKLPKDLFAPDAEVVLISCSTASGTDAADAGSEKLRRMFSPLLKQGGTVIASTRYVQPNYAVIPREWQDASPAQIAGDHLLPPLMAPIFAAEHFLKNAETRHNRVVKIKVEAQP